MSDLYNTNDIIQVVGTSPWSDLEILVEVVGKTTNEQLELLGISFYDLWFNGQGMDSLYNSSFLDSSNSVYVCSEVISENPYARETNEKKFIYLHDILFDKNKTDLLVKRTELIIPVSIGNFYSGDITSDFVKEVNAELVSVASNYSRTSYAKTSTTNIFLKTKSDATAIDLEFNIIQMEVEEKLREAEEEKAAYEKSLKDRESSIIYNEEQQIYRQQVLDNTEEMQTDKETYLNDRENILDGKETILNQKEIELTTQESELDARAQLIWDYEEELGIPHSTIIQ